MSNTAREDRFRRYVLEHKDIGLERMAEIIKEEYNRRGEKSMSIYCFVPFKLVPFQPSAILHISPLDTKDPYIVAERIQLQLEPPTIVPLPPEDDEILARWLSSPSTEAKINIDGP